MFTPKLVITSWLMFLFLIIGIAAKAQPVAAFSATPLSGCAPLVVNFVDQSTGAPTQWKWDLGNSTISFLQNPSVTYFNPGTYSIKLVVQNAAGRDSVTRTQYIHVTAQPSVSFDADKVTGCFPLPVTFTENSTPGTGTVTSWQWDFGDGNFSGTQTASHTYTAAGDYNISLRVGNSAGCFKTLTRPLYIHINEGVNADFTHSQPNTCTAPVSINFQNQSAGTGTLTYEWNFGDGSQSTDLNPSHTYTAAGTYSVSLIAINSTGCRDTITQTDAIVVGGVNADFLVPQVLCQGAPLNFQNTSAPAPVNASWSFGDGTVSSVISPVKVFATAGTFPVKLVSNFGACLDSVTYNVTVLAKPVTSFTADKTAGCNVPFTVHFTSNVTGANSYKWDFGDGGSATFNSPTHTYTQTGLYTVSLITGNSAGCYDTLVKQQYIRIALPEASILNLPQEGCAPLSWTFTSSTISAEPVTAYQWNFGDGTTSTQANPTHIFAAGEFDITLIILTASGCTDTVTIPKGIKAGVKPHANFIAAPRDVCAYLPVNFQDLSTGTIDRWLWDFGDGGTSTQQNPSHIYNDTGFFNITLIVYNNGCADTVVFNDYVHIKPPIAAFDFTFDCRQPLIRVFTDKSIGADEWHWNFGDGTTSTIPSPTHTYAGPGTYTVSLTVRNTETGCEYTFSQSVQVVVQQINFSAGSATVCRNNNVTFTAVSTDPVNTSDYKWDFGDGALGAGNPATHAYPSAGNFTVTLFATNVLGCNDTIVKPQLITVNGPKAAFVPQASGSCLLSTIGFTDNSTDDGIHPITNWTWNFGDGNIENFSAGPFSHTYNTPGIYTVKLAVTDNSGCKDSIASATTLTISSPHADFRSADTLTCPGRTVKFFTESTGPMLTYKWYFGDGTTSTLADPDHIYTADGNYNVSLVIRDQYGCGDSIAKPQFIKVATPVANYALSDSISSCPPMVVNFTNNAQNATSIRWDFGDGTTSQLQNPSHFYNIPGTYIARLTVTGSGGCTSIKEKTIIVKGPYGTFTYQALTGCKPLVVSFRATTQSRLSFIWDFNDGTTLTTPDSIVSHTYTIAGIYVPKMILRDANGCMVPVTGLDTIVVNGVQAGFTPDKQVLCDNGTVSFTNNTASNDVITGYQWDFGDGQTSTLENPSHFYTATGLYYPKLKVRTESGCIDSIASPLPVRIVKKPDLSATKSADGCVPLTVTFNSSLQNADTSAIAWRWTLGNGNTSTLQQPAGQQYLQAGTFPVQAIVVNSSGCSDTATLSVRAFAIPSVNAGLDTMICKDRPVTLHATGAATYQWSPSTGLSCNNCASPAAAPDSLRQYFVTGTSADGCKKTDSVWVKVKYPFHMLASPADTLCVGSAIVLQSSGAHSYSWSPAAGLSSTVGNRVTATPSTTTTYRVIGTDDRNCFTDTVFVPVKVYPIPTVEAGEDKTINVGQMIDLVPVISNDVNSVIWSPTGGGFRNNYPAITVKPTETTKYTVKARNQGGCTSQDELIVHVLCNGANVFIPNTFSPNGDGANDIFYPRGTGLFTIKTVRIFSRWGEVVFQKNNIAANDANAGWDGTFKGQKLTPDVYIYQVEIVCDNNTTLTYKGNVALIK